MSDTTSTAAALFLRDGADTFTPTVAARGAWDRRIVHGSAVAALLAGHCDQGAGTLARMTLDFLAPVPFGTLRLQLSEVEGGRRVQRQRATLLAEDRPVATATAVFVAVGHIDVPERAVDRSTPFDPDAVPPLDEANRASLEIVGHECFDTLAAVVQRHRVEGDRRVHQWISLTMPVVADTTLQGIEVAAVAADYAQAAVHRNLDFREWSYRNAEQTLHLARAPRGSWVGVRCEAVVGETGAGFNSGDLFDVDGRFGQSAATLVVEHRGPTGAPG